MQTVQIRKVESQADFKPFFEFPWTLYKDDPNWVPPLLSMRREVFDKQKGPAWEYLEGDFFAAYRGDQIVGTIAAYINHRHNEFQGEQIGWFGAFEVFNDPEAAAALLNTACEWVKARGFSTIRGPQTFTTHEDVGLLVDGFTRPILLMPYNPPYYAGFIEAAGFTKLMDMYSFHLSRAMTEQSALMERLERVASGIMRRSKITIRPVDRRNLKAEFKLFKDLYNAAWDKNWGFVPMTPRELDGLVESLGTFFDPELAYFGYVDGEPAGFILGVPDFNQVLQRAYARPGTPELWTLLRALWFWKVRPVIDWARIPLMGVVEKHRRRGLDAALYYHVMKALVAGRYQHGDSGWILAANDNMVSIALNFGSEIYKTYRFFEKSL